MRALTFLVGLIGVVQAAKLRPVPVEIPADIVISNLHRKYDLSLPAITRINTVMVIKALKSSVGSAYISIDAEADDVFLAQLAVSGKSTPGDQVETPLSVSKATFDAKK
jgi:hypothetical protein